MGYKKVQLAQPAFTGTEYNSRSGYGHGGYAVTAYSDECCPGVVDPLTLLVALAAVGAATFFLRQTAIDRLGRSLGWVAHFALGRM